MFAKSYAVYRDTPGSYIKRPHAGGQSYDPPSLCGAYGWPTVVPVTQQIIVIGELGGHFYPSDVQAWASKMGIPVPQITTHLLSGGNDSPSDADGEVALDWQLAAASYSFMTGLPAKIVIVFGPNSGQAFADVHDYAATLANVGAISWSWGAPESGWSAAERSTFDASCQRSHAPIFAASGDNNSNDGTNAPVTDFPSSSPFCVGCGGTSRPPSGAEVVWNNGNGSGTGGGFSKVYPRPVWQPANSQGTGRMVPDLAAVADPQTGYNVLINGRWEVIGGTSAVAPLMSGFFAVVNGARARANLAPLSQINSLLWSNASSYFDVASGNNGTYKASTGPDPCSGLGRPLGTLVSALSGSGQTPPPNTVAVPDVIGATVANASSVITAAGLVPSVQRETSGTVTAENPAAGTQVAKGTTVILTVSSVVPTPPGQTPLYTKTFARNVRKGELISFLAPVATPVNSTLVCYPPATAHAEEETPLFREE